MRNSILPAVCALQTILFAVFPRNVSGGGTGIPDMFDAETFLTAAAIVTGLVFRRPVMPAPSMPVRRSPSVASTGGQGGNRGGGGWFERFLRRFTNRQDTPLSIPAAPHEDAINYSMHVHNIILGVPDSRFSPTFDPSRVHPTRDFTSFQMIGYFPSLLHSTIENAVNNVARHRAQRDAQSFSGGFRSGNYTPEAELDIVVNNLIRRGKDGFSAEALIFVNNNNDVVIMNVYASGNKISATVSTNPGLINNTSSDFTIPAHALLYQLLPEGQNFEFGGSLNISNIYPSPSLLSGE